MLSQRGAYRWPNRVKRRSFCFLVSKRTVLSRRKIDSVAFCQLGVVHGEVRLEAEAASTNCQLATARRSLSLLQDVRLIELDKLIA